MAFWESAFGGSAGGSYRLRQQVDVIGQEVGNNRTLVRYNAWVEKVAGSGYWSSSAASGSTNINGYVPGRSWPNYDFRAYAVRHIAQNEDYWINHDSNGDANPYFAVSFDLANSPYLTSASVGGNMAMPHINRYANITGFTVSNTTDVSFQLNVTTDVTCNAVQYSLEDGVGWRSQPDGNFTSKSFTIGGSDASALPSGKAYNLRVRVRRADNNLWTESGVISTTTLNQNNFFDFTDDRFMNG